MFHVPSRVVYITEHTYIQPTTTFPPHCFFTGFVASPRVKHKNMSLPERHNSPCLHGRPRRPPSPPPNPTPGRTLEALQVPLPKSQGGGGGQPEKARRKKALCRYDPEHCLCRERVWQREFHRSTTYVVDSRMV